MMKRKILIFIFISNPNLLNRLIVSNYFSLTKTTQPEKQKQVLNFGACIY